MAADRHHYLEQKLEQQDRDFLLTRGFANKDDRPLLTALHSLRAELKAIPGQVSDSGVALSKISWWHNEWQRLGEGRARHPISQILQDLLPGPPPPLSDASLALAQICTNENCWDDMGELVQFAEKLARPFAALEAFALVDQAPTVDLVRSWRDIELITIVIDANHWSRAGRRVLPMNLAARHQVGQAVMAHADPSTNSAMQDLLEATRAQVEADYGGCGRSHTHIYREVQLARLRWLLRNPGSVSGPTSLRRLWSAWRGARDTRSRQHA